MRLFLSTAFGLLNGGFVTAMLEHHNYARPLLNGCLVGIACFCLAMWVKE